MSNVKVAAELPSLPGPGALNLIRAGKVSEAVEMLKTRLRQGELAKVTDEIVRGMLADDLSPVGVLARITADLRLRGCLDADSTAALAPPVPDQRRLSVGKLHHDIAQLRYLRELGIALSPTDRVIARYEQILDRLAIGGPEAREGLTESDQAEVGVVYGRLAHMRPTPRVDRALSDTWDPSGVEERYLTDRLGLVVVDDFLSERALEELLAFCTDSTVWNANRYPHGRLGAFFDVGFNCPLLLQIAEELRASFPWMIGSRHRLRQLWGFKYPPRMPGEGSLHADFAAVNVNFWITPDRANRDPSSGGLLVYDADAPRDWDFERYNRRPDLIEAYLRQHRVQVLRIPYRQNRAIIFNSDLFHSTEGIEFGRDYLDRRINVTMLYGVREHDDRRVVGESRLVATPATGQMWRSSAFTRTRR